MRVESSLEWVFHATFFMFGAKVKVKSTVRMTVLASGHV